MRGDDDDFVDGEHYLMESEALRGIPVFTTTGERLGTLDGAIVHRASGGIVSVVLVRHRLYGLLRRRIVLPRAALRTAGANGGFVVDWPLRDTLREEVAAPSAMAPLALPRLDPARGE